MKIVVWSLVVLLVILHQGFWQWGDSWSNAPLVQGFLPISLVYHAAISLAAAGVWALALKFCWSDDLDTAGDDDSAAKELE
jgi:hypothetical protein